MSLRAEFFAPWICTAPVRGPDGRTSSRDTPSIMEDRIVSRVTRASDGRRSRPGGHAPASRQRIGPRDCGVGVDAFCTGGQLRPPVREWPRRVRNCSKRWCGHIHQPGRTIRALRATGPLERIRREWLPLEYRDQPTRQLSTCTPLLGLALPSPRRYCTPQGSTARRSTLVGDT